MKEKKKLGLGVWIMIGLAAGIAFGAILWAAMGAEAATDFTASYLKPFGDIFVNLLKFIVVPLVLLSIMDGMFSMGDIGKVGKIGWKTVVYFLATTAVACVIGLVVANLFKGSFPVLSLAEDAAYEAKESDIMTTIKNIFPSNSVQPMIDASMLQIIVIALLIGAGIILTGEKGRATAELFESLNEVFMKVMMFIIKISPIGVFCMMTWVVSNQGPEILGDLAKVLGVAYLGYILHAVITYSITVKTMGGMSPFKFFKGMIPAMVFAFSSTSSVATLPINKECAVNLGASEEVSSFVLPLGATINMDGTAVYMAVNTIFLSCCYGMNLTVGQLVMVVVTATLASIGTAGVSGAGVVMLAMVLTSVGIPVEGILLIYGIDRLFDMGRTTINIVGDAACAVIVSRLEAKKEAKKAAMVK